MTISHDLPENHGVPVVETQAGKGALPWDHPNQAGAIGVTGTSAANALAAEADVRAGDRHAAFPISPTASRSLFQNPDWRLIQLNIQPFDAVKHGARPLVADARRGIRELAETLSDWRAPTGMDLPSS